MTEFKTTYDPEADAVYIRLSEEPSYEGEDAGPLTLFYTQDGRVVGIEVLGVSQVLAPGAWSEAPPPGAFDAGVQAAE